ncbi:MAG: 1-(5-phosphoribosyl)-5-[(5-phosphoribosylamino)methylideneamino]imidazole-4-carboxamide isomerase [Spirochaetota bacterium]|nr:MAG: 1-(5-phosphoribosyl)-5-[(5-phosphoribosylamino)methylideneamino]imidazole-4-carboxamide isomerase [Spirochaetota bacterium]
MLFIPAIDLIDGRCVRLLQGDYAKKTEYSHDPVGVAKSFEDQGTKYLHIVDLDAAKGGDRNNRSVIQKVVSALKIPVQVGGGVRDRKKIVSLLDIGVERVILGTIIVRAEALARELVAEFKGKIVAGIDAQNGIVRISGWTEGTGLKAMTLGKQVRDMGFSLIIYTDIMRDGMMEGPNLQEVKRMSVETGIPLIASGGISSLDDLKKLKPLEAYGIQGVIAGKAIYEKNLSVREAVRVLEEEC